MRSLLKRWWFWLGIVVLLGSLSVGLVRFGQRQIDYWLAALDHPDAAVRPQKLSNASMALRTSGIEAVVYRWRFWLCCKRQRRRKGQ